MTTTRTILGRDEAIMEHSRALDRLAATLIHHRARSLATILHGRRRRPLTIDDQHALDSYTRVTRRVIAAGHGDIIDEQLEGFLSALEHDRSFRLPLAA